MGNKVSTHKLPQRKIGTNNVPALGFGLMGMSAFYTHGEDPQEAEKKHLEVLTKAANDGETFWDTSDIYGPFTNEEVIGKWFR
jgi:aryl-alcohol dehydrogenase-like predicted oxidoreductase